VSKNDVASLGLGEAIETIRSELLGAQAGATTTDLHFPVTSVTVELKVVAAKEVGGKAGFKVPLVPVEIGAEGSRHWENAHTVTVVLGSPIDGLGRQVQVERTSPTLPG
jgi:Trypsin-co-occurring domain 2